MSPSQKNELYLDLLILELATNYDNAITKHAKSATIANQINKQTLDCRH